MKSFLVCLLLSVSTLATAQKVVFKKGKVLYDKTPIANVEEVKGVYTISTLDNEPVVIADPRIADGQKFYVRVTLPEDKEKVVLVRPTHKKWSMSKSKIVIDEFTFGIYKIFTPTGLDKEAAKAIMTYDDSETRAMLEANRKAYVDTEEYVKGFSSQNWVFNDLGEFGRNEKGSFVSYGKVKRYKDNGGINIVYDISVYDNTTRSYILVGKWNEKRDRMFVLNNGEAYMLPDVYSAPTLSLDMDKVAKAMVYLVKK
ncbi:hypothetical protein VSP10_12385 [Myroides odoratimimus]|uniref:DUF4468 domain-containing protein n=1 Tax=Myroides odoratimimus CIP 101113 TaxID=883154 RepID=A0AAV3F196_9FLAO|nr:hypothetical protein [Myroides odoratimimus]EHO07995.1 hypothetical protein HMPREF9714_02363 [Myroides odoratimimus CCUG 12901]EHO09382.1 hypothetical protein HMPREF9715_02461 [Myroides odoratimimus CIP 101113]EPH13576.1 hypothetical protein HMPREF9713_00523 [Myroides odoratimimus CCUG 12700]MEC4027032.1 hypothetical protein [Myroides odoratimimus]MEC4053584.1 hypothetical protein [Myroides odoratimimus]